MVEATAIPIASSVMTVSAPFATDFSARSSVITTINPKKAAAAIVSHIGKDAERQMCSSDAADAQFMRDTPDAASGMELTFAMFGRALAMRMSNPKRNYN